MFWFDQFKEILRENNIHYNDGVEFIEFYVMTQKKFPIRFFIDTDGSFFEFSAYATIGVYNKSLENFIILNKLNNTYKMFKFSFTKDGNIRIEVDIPNKFYKDIDYTFYLINETNRIVDEIGYSFTHYNLS